MTREELLNLYNKFKTQKALASYLKLSAGQLKKLLAENNIVKCWTKIKKAKENFIEKAKKVHGDKFDYSQVVYERSCLKVKIKCNRCGQYFYQTPNNHLTGQGCPYCKDALNSKKQLKSLETFIEEAKAIHGDKYDYSQVVYEGTNKKVKIYCKKCKRFFYKSPSKHLSYKQGCPHCVLHHSRGENDVYDWLIANKIDFITQKKFTDCRDKRPLPFDFYLPEYNICIEYQGRQHYKFEKNSQYCKTKEEYLSVKQHDKIKREYCLKNNIKLFEINYRKNLALQFKKIVLYIHTLTGKIS